MDGTSDDTSYHTSWPLLERYKSYLLASGQRTGTVYNKVLAAGRFFRWAGSRTPDDASRLALIPDYLAARCRHYAPNTYVVEFRRLKLFADWAVMTGVLPTNPLAEVPAPKQRAQEVDPFSDDEIVRLFAATECPAGRALMVLLLSTGIRISEAINAEWSDLRDDVLTVHGKGGKTRKVPVGRLALRLLDALPRISPYIFPISVAGAQMRFYRLARETGIHVHAHRFRHTFACKFLERSHDLQALQTLLGHSNIGTTLVYLSVGRQERALAEARRCGCPDDMLGESAGL